MQWQNASQEIVNTEGLLLAYQSLNINDSPACDAFFAKFGAGNITAPQEPYMNLIDRPYERLSVYEHILLELSQNDLGKYQKMHKGTPYFFISWLAFTVKDFEKAIHFMDSAISEDIRNFSSSQDPNRWQSTPAARFLFLDPNQPYAVARSIMKIISDEFQSQLTRFNSVSGASMTIPIYQTKFIAPNVDNLSYRSIFSALNVFVMEYPERKKMLTLQTSSGSSIEAFLMHLFKGCLIFESLLKIKYGGVTGDLGSLLSSPGAKNALGIEQGQYLNNPVYRRDKPRDSGYTLPVVLSLLSKWSSETYQERIVATTYAMRNTVGHDLSWQVVFDNNTYQEIYQSIIDSILWLIWKAY